MTPRRIGATRHKKTAEKSATVASRRRGFGGRAPVESVPQGTKKQLRNQQPSLRDAGVSGAEPP